MQPIVQTEFERNYAWVRRHMPLTRTQIAALPALDGVRLACSMHLDIKSVVALEGLLERGAQVFLTTCNPYTVRDEVVAYLTARGAEAYTWYGISTDEQQQAAERAISWNPTHLCEMGADLSSALIVRGASSTVMAGLEATGSGITRLQRLATQGQSLAYPVFNWDDVPIKEALHNRYLVGWSTWQAFGDRTHLSLHRKRVLVVGYGLVGQGLAMTARANGGVVMVAERSSERALDAMYAGFETGSVESLLPSADVVVTATGAAGVIGMTHLPLFKDGCFLLNAGHTSEEIDVSAFGERVPVIPYVEEVRVGDRTIYIFAGAAMANLVAGQGDSINSFDLTLAIMVAGLRFIFSLPHYDPGVHLLPPDVWREVAAQALG